MKSYVGKDLMLFWRDRKELVTVLVLPVLLVIILHYAFAGMFGHEKRTPPDLQLAVVQLDDDTDALPRLKEKLMEEAGFQEAEAAAFVEQASSLLPAQAIVNQLESDEWQEWLTVHSLSEEAAAEGVEAGELDGMLMIPAGFTVDSLYAAAVKEAPEIHLVYHIKSETNSSQPMFHMIQGIIDKLNVQLALQQYDGMAEAEVIMPEGGYEEVGAGERFNLAQYFTIAMGALFSLFVAATVATKTGVEIREQVFNRIIMTNRHPMFFLLGKMVSTFILAWLQMMVVFVLSQLILNVFPDRSLTFWLGIVAFVSLLALSIAGLAAVFTSILLRMTNIDAANGVFMLVIVLLGLLGGNFVPIYVLPAWLRSVGEWTPNGLSLTLLTEWVQLEEWSLAAIWLTGFFALFTLVSLALYPRRGGIR